MTGNATLAVTTVNGASAEMRSVLLPSSGGFGRGFPAVLRLEDLVHDLGSGGDHGAQFSAVDDFGGARAGVPGQAGDLLDWDALVAHHADHEVRSSFGTQRAPIPAAAVTRRKSR